MSHFKGAKDGRSVARSRYDVGGWVEKSTLGGGARARTGPDAFVAPKDMGPADEIGSGDMPSSSELRSGAAPAMMPAPDDGAVSSTKKGKKK